MGRLVIAIDDPRRDDVRALLEAHVAFNRALSPPEDMHAFDADALVESAVTLWSARAAGELVGLGGLLRLDDAHAELKSMHVARTARGRGVGRALVEHLIAAARERGFRRLSLETGAMDEFAPARALYASVGFVECGPFARYVLSPYSVFATRPLD